MDFYREVGKMAVGSRLRRLGERMKEDSAKTYSDYGIGLEPKWFPVFYVLTQKQELSISEIARIVGTPHPAVSQQVKEMGKRGLTISTKAEADARVTMVRLTKQGQQLTPMLQLLCKDVTSAAESLLAEMQYDLWKAIEETEFLLSQKNIRTRVREARKARESREVEILNYTPEFQQHFLKLNKEWIERYFKMEDGDRQSLQHPDEKIISPGGHIFMARYNDQIVGTCALIKMDGQTYELAKMAVTESARGKHVGWLLGQATIKKAKELGASRLFLESNTVLKPAINLYEKLGFKKISGGAPSLYERCNIQMELILD